MLVLFGSVRFRSTHQHKRVSGSGGVASSTDQGMFANRLPEAFLMGTLLFLVLASGECTTTQESFNRKKETWRLQ
ncbi:hypothetical protein F2Q69_00037788 [Brassica cretica]|uniref:Uncharacterized protein n=1 Tax=Brassica cretica TaxID=69181 RepID=A0A8S9SN34_BRACR|nr:hypothetical protein F2Q69_00037788 [Brassica cretica]